MSNLPKNGRVIIVDDQIEQALPLMQYFSKQKVAFTYFDGKAKNLPDEGFDDLRLLFLDLNLEDDCIPGHSLIRKLQGRIKKLISKVSHPYILIIWSRHNDEVKDFDNIFKPATLQNKKPITTIILDKIDYFDLEGKSTGKHFRNLGDDLSKKLEAYPEIQCIFDWEATVHQATNEVASLFFPKFGEYATWSEETRQMFCKFSEASLGKHFNEVEESVKINGAFEVLHQLFMDELETKFYSQEKPKFLQETKAPKITDYSVNTRLLIETTEKISDVNYPGNILHLSNLDPKARAGKFLKLINRDLLCELATNYYNTKFEITYDLKKFKAELMSFTNFQSLREELNEIPKREQQKLLKEYRNDHIIPHLKFVQISIDQLCDYVQKKIVFNKYVEGIIFPKFLKEVVTKSSEALYISPIFEYEGKPVFLVIDYSTFNTNAIVGNPLFLFRLRGSILGEIQSKFSRYLSRQGLLYLA